jgi:hypothetical protein
MDCILQEEQKLTDLVNEFNDRYAERIVRPRTINETIEFSSTLLLKCVQYGHTDLIKRCIKLGSRLEDHDSYGRTALCWALLENRVDIARLLLKAGANPNVKITECYSEHDTPIVFLLLNNYFCDKRLELLVEYGVLLNDYKENLSSTSTCSTRHFFKIMAKRRWVKIKCIVLTLSLHKRAVVTANHPLRLLERGDFNKSD